MVLHTKWEVGSEREYKMIISGSLWDKNGEIFKFENQYIWHTLQPFHVAFHSYAIFLTYMYYTNLTDWFLVCENYLILVKKTLLNGTLELHFLHIF